MKRKNLLNLSLVSFGVIISFLCISGVLMSKAYAEPPTFDSNMGMYISLAENPFTADDEKTKITQKDNSVEITSAITYSDNFKGNVTYTWHYKLDGTDTWIDIDSTGETLDFDTSTLAPGNYIFQVVAKDDLGNSCTQDFKITVSGDTLPSSGKTDKDGKVVLNDNKQDPTKDQGGDNIGNTTITITDEDGNPIENAEVEIDDDGKIHIKLPDGTEKTDVIIKVTDDNENPIENKPVEVLNPDDTVRVDSLTDKNGEIHAPVTKEKEDSATDETDNSSSENKTASGDTNKEESKSSLPTTGDKTLDFLIVFGAIDLMAIVVIAVTLLRKKEGR